METIKIWSQGDRNSSCLENTGRILNTGNFIEKVHLDDLVVLNTLKFTLIVSSKTCKEVKSTSFNLKQEVLRRDEDWPEEEISKHPTIGVRMRHHTSDLIGKVTSHPPWHWSLINQPPSKVWILNFTVHLYLFQVSSPSPYINIFIYISTQKTPWFYPHRPDKQEVLRRDEDWPEEEISKHPTIGVRMRHHTSDLIGKVTSHPPWHWSLINQPPSKVWILNFTVHLYLFQVSSPSPYINIFIYISTQKTPWFYPHRPEVTGSLCAGLVVPVKSTRCHSAGSHQPHACSLRTTQGFLHQRDPHRK